MGDFFANRSESGWAKNIFAYVRPEGEMEDPSVVRLVSVLQGLTSLAQNVSGDILELMSQTTVRCQNERLTEVDVECRALPE